LSEDMYKQMILALPPEFFQDWQWKAGDTAILMDDPYKRQVVIINSTYEISINTIAKRGRAELLFAGSMEKEFITEAFDRLRPIPNIEQLLYMLIKKYNNDKIECNELSFLDGFSVWINLHEPAIKTLNYKCLFLDFAVRHILEVKWNGEKWI